MLLIIRQQVQPDSLIEHRQSQQAWIILQQLLSPLVQLMQTPFLVISHLHMPIVMLQVQTGMPFIMQQQLHMPPDIMLQRFCNMLQATWSSQLQWIFMPSAHFSNFISQRGSIIQLLPAGIEAGAPIDGLLMPGIIVPRSIIIALDMENSFFRAERPAAR